MERAAPIALSLTHHARPPMPSYRGSVVYQLVYKVFKLRLIRSERGVIGNDAALCGSGPIGRISAPMALLDWIAPESGLRVDGEGVSLRLAAGLGPHADMARIARRQPRLPVAMGADLAGRRPWPRGLPPPAERLCPRPGRGRRISVLRASGKSDGCFDRVGITLSNVRRGVAQMGSVGYWCGRPYARHGHTLSAVRALSDFAFRSLGLHRLEAACIPENAPSRRLLGKAGFDEEGFAKAYLKINGVWRDHVLFGLISCSSSGQMGSDEGVSAPAAIAGALWKPWGSKVWVRVSARRQARFKLAGRSSLGDAERPLDVGRHLDA